MRKIETETKLLQKAKTGNTESILTLLERYEPLCQKASRNSALSSIREDALSEAHLSLLEAIKNYDFNRNIPFAGYAKALIYGKMRSLFKKHRLTLQREERAFPVEETLSSFSKDLCTIEQKDIIMRLMKPLSKRQQEIIQLVFFEDMTQIEIAKKLGISQQAVAKALKKALFIMHSIAVKD